MWCFVVTGTYSVVFCGDRYLQCGVCADRYLQCGVCADRYLQCGVLW